MSSSKKLSPQKLSIENLKIKRTPKMEIKRGIIIFRNSRITLNEITDSKNLITDSIAWNL